MIDTSSILHYRLSQRNLITKGSILFQKLNNFSISAKNQSWWVHQHKLTSDHKVRDNCQFEFLVLTANERSETYFQDNGTNYFRYKFQDMEDIEPATKRE